MAGLELLGGEHSGLEYGGLQGIEESAGDSLVDLLAAEIEAVHATPVDDVW